MASEAGAGPALDAATREIPELEALLTQAMIAGASHGSGETRLDDAYDAAARLVRGLRRDLARECERTAALRQTIGLALNGPGDAEVGMETARSRVVFMERVLSAALDADAPGAGEGGEG